MDSYTVLTAVISSSVTSRVEMNRYTFFFFRTTLMSTCMVSKLRAKNEQLSIIKKVIK
jgi:hypothetical protein